MKQIIKRINKQTNSNIKTPPYHSFVGTSLLSLCGSFPINPLQGLDPLQRFDPLQVLAGRAQHSTTDNRAQHSTLSKCSGF